MCPQVWHKTDFKKHLKNLKLIKVILILAACIFFNIFFAIVILVIKEKLQSKEIIPEVIIIPVRKKMTCEHVRTAELLQYA